MLLPERVILGRSFELEDFNLKSMKSHRPFSHSLRSNLRLLCKSLSLVASTKNNISVISDY